MRKGPNWNCGSGSAEAEARASSVEASTLARLTVTILTALDTPGIVMGSPDSSRYTGVLSLVPSLPNCHCIHACKHAEIRDFIG